MTCGACRVRVRGVKSNMRRPVPQCRANRVRLAPGYPMLYVCIVAVPPSTGKKAVSRILTDSTYGFFPADDR